MVVETSELEVWKSVSNPEWSQSQNLKQMAFDSVRQNNLCAGGRGISTSGMVQRVLSVSLLHSS